MLTENDLLFIISLNDLLYIVLSLLKLSAVINSESTYRIMLFGFTRSSA